MMRWKCHLCVRVFSKPTTLSQHISQYHPYASTGLPVPSDGNQFTPNIVQTPLVIEPSNNVLLCSDTDHNESILPQVLFSDRQETLAVIDSNRYEIERSASLDDGAEPVSQDYIWRDFIDRY